ncbi:zinc-ribbon domain-containing protein [Anaerococcus sp. WCA-380-WT-2B]|uniref:Zinc-ribbon domain-containing protein n=1 Tax=Anaerococcus porci TaxID=2652269 RepID=A0A6N7VDE1_9FIRM|nr:zinc-ribbon domain-containing protein [Anaerococcus porci]MSS77468.1 zinc-ribbon domain-containing protein [Anaerococcus porci]
MYCQNCGHPNEDGAKFCNNCGSKLNYDSNPNNNRNKDQETTQKLRPVREDFRENINNNDSRNTHRNYKNEKVKLADNYNNYLGIKKVIITVLIIIFIIVLIVGAIRFALIDNKETNDTVGGEISSNKVSSSLKNESNDFAKVLSDAKSLIKNGEFEMAVTKLKTIPKSTSSDYKKAEDLLKDAEERAVDQLVDIFNSRDYEKAESLSSKYIELFPKSQDIAVVNDRAKEELGKDDKENNKKKSIKERKQEFSKDYDIDNIISNDLWDKNGNPSYVEFYKAEDFMGKDLTVDISVGQLRASPSIKSEKKGEVRRGEVVHPTKVESDGERYWLYIGKGWISSKLVTGEFHKE